MTDIQPPQPLDHVVRQQALDIRASYAVSAPAGSGKTGLLTLRVLKLLAIVDNPEEILCITFTNKAASEMRERILQALTRVKSMAADDIQPGAEGDYQAELNHAAYAVLKRSEDKDWNIIESPARLKILTIDGFCRSIANKFPIESGIHAKSSILKDPDFVYANAIKACIKELQEEKWADEYQLLLSHFDNNLNRLHDLLIRLLATRDQWLPLISEIRAQPALAKAFFEQSLANWRAELAEQIAAQAVAYETELGELGLFAQKNIVEENPNHILSRFQVEDFSTPDGICTYWQPIVSVLLTGTGSFRAKLDKRCGFPASTKLDKEKKQQAQQIINELSTIPDFADSLNTARAFPENAYLPQDWKIIEALIRVLPLAVAHLKILFHQTDSTDFIEIAQAAQVLTHVEQDSVSDISLKLDYQIRHILVDEFQDTSQPQIRLLHSLVSGWEKDDGRTLFFVGDGMQSCYGFRNANVGIFLDVRSSGLNQIELAPLDLTVNFRSTQRIVSWVNDIFSRAFPFANNISRGAVSYAHSDAFKSSENNTEDTYTQCRGFIDEKDTRQTESQYIAEQILQLLVKYPQDSIAILVRSRSDLKTIIPLLQKYNIPFEAVEIDPLKNKPYIQDMLSLVKALHSFSDRLAWISVLRAPWCALDFFDLKALYEFEQSNELNSLWQSLLLHADNADLSDISHPLIYRVINAFQKAKDAFQRVPLKRLVEALWIELGGPNCLSNESHRQDINALLALIDQFEQAGRIIEWDRFNLNLEKLFAKPSTGDSVLQLMTMHKSKGLEFDSVFLPCLDKAAKAESSALLYWHERLNQNHETDILLTPVAASNTADNNPLTQFIREEKKIKSQLEQTRLFYVACTRAKSRLYLTGQLKVDAKDNIVPSAKTSMLGQCWDALSPHFSIISSEDLSPLPADTTENVSHSILFGPNLLARLPLTTEPWEIDADIEAVSHSPLTEMQSREANDRTNHGYRVFEQTPPGSFAINTLERASGTLFHRILRQITLDGIGNWDQAKIREMTPFWLRQLAQLGVTPREGEARIEKIGRCIHHLLSDSQAQWLLNNCHTESACEYEILYGDQPKKIVIDRTFVDKGTRWIVDYKTSCPASSESLDDFIQREKEAYSKQLGFYQQALHSIDSFRQSTTKVSNYQQALYFPFLMKLILLN